MGAVAGLLRWGMRRQIPTTLTVELDQLARLIDRRIIVRDAIERPPKRYLAPTFADDGSG